MRILYITQTFPPEPGPTIRPLRQAAHLQQLGHSVTIVTTMPNAPLGRVFDGYRRKPWMRETIEGVAVLRVWSFAVPNKGFLLRTISCLSFCIAASVCGCLLRRRELVIASVPNIATEMAGLLIARARGSRFLLEMRDLIPESLALVGVSSDSPFWRLLKAYFRQMYKQADFVAVPGAAMAAHLENEGVPRRKLLLLPHAADEVENADVSEISQPVQRMRGFVAMYCGSFSVYYDLETMIEAARVIEQRDWDICICLVGTGRELRKIQGLLRDRPCNRILILDPVSPDQVTRYLRYANVALSPYVAHAPCPFFDGYLTTKTVQYLHAGKPIIAVERVRVLRDFLKEIGVGVAVPSGDPVRLAEAIRDFALHPEETARCGQRARAYADQFLKRSKIVADFERELLARLEDPKGSAGSAVSGP